MKTYRMAQRALFIAMIAIVGSGLTPAVTRAAPADYVFEVVDQPIKSGKDAPFAVRIAAKDGGHAVANARIDDVKLHMPMGTMDMAAPSHFREQDGKGLYRFSGDLTMYGPWVLDLSVTLPDEKEPVRTSITFKVVK